MAFMDDLNGILSGDADSCAFPSLPYAQFLGFQGRANKETGGLEVVMPFDQSLIGSPNPPRLHGGTVGALLEFAGSVAVIYEASKQLDLTIASLPKPISITVEFMRGGATEDMFARAEVLRLGRRIANVRALSWQSDPSRINATATMTFLMPSADDMSKLGQ